jgi:MarR family transcriptional regulator, organic hydroperoxide resistance regulator
MLDHGLRSLSKRMEQNLGVTGPQRFALRLLGAATRALSAGELAEALKLHPSTLTGILDRLVKAGLVERNAAPEDARRAVLSLSSAGAKLNRKQAGTVEAAVRQTLAEVVAADLAATHRVLSRLVRALEEG